MEKKIIITGLFFMLSALFSNSLDTLKLKEESAYKDPEFAKKIAFIPGAGQFYNEDYLKGSLIIVSEFYTLAMADKFSSNIIKRNSFIWWSLGIYILNIIDAYIDAELSSFPNEEHIIEEKEK